MKITKNIKIVLAFLVTLDIIHRMRYDKTYNKTIEELMELATVLMQQQNKQQSRDYTDEIEEEIGDVYMWLGELSKRFDQNKINKRIESKRLRYFDK